VAGNLSASVDFPQAGRLEEALALLKKQEALCLELGNRRSLAEYYWAWAFSRGNMIARRSGKS
jgi:hypothetical protein